MHVGPLRIRTNVIGNERNLSTLTDKNFGAFFLLEPHHVRTAAHAVRRLWVLGALIVKQ